MSSSKIHTKEMICSLIIIVVGCLTTLSHSTAISTSSTGSSGTTTSTSSKTNFKGNGILRDGDGNQEIGIGAAVKSHKKQINGNDADFIANNPNDDDAYSADDIANDVDNLNAFDENVADDQADDFVSVEIDDQLSLKDQMRMLTQQMTRRFQHELKAAVRKTKDLFKSDFQAQLEQLRHEVKSLKKIRGSQSSSSTHAGSNVGNKERLTVDWFLKVIAEFRAELTELQDAQNNTTRRLQQRNCAEELVELRDDFDKLKLEWNAIRLRQENLEQTMKDLQTEAIQRDDDFRRSQIQNQKAPGTIDYVKPEADHRLRHRRFIRQHLHDLDVVQKAMKRQLNELQHHHIGERLHNLENEQKRLANANFNMSRQVASLDRLHGSMLELLEDIEGIQNKFDKTIPDIKREISKVEFNAAQVASEYALLREEGQNAAKSIQALAVSVSALQDDRDVIKQLEQTVNDLKHNFTKVRAGAFAHRHMFHKRIEKIESDSKSKSPQQNVIGEIQMASKLVKQLETVEHQYESIINKLPSDCSQIEQNSTGLFMIAPGGQQHPILANCVNQWTTIQRRNDGSVDFNRSWDEYSQGFGTPSGEYWIGNTILNHLTADNCTSLKIIMQDIYDNTWEAIYSTFNVATREDGYRLSISGYSGNASDAFQYQNDMQFSAIDVDRDISNTHCAGNYEGGWWFSHCQHANLNGRYNLGLTWFDASRNEWIAVKSSHMMISKRTNCALPYTAPPPNGENNASRSSNSNSLSSANTISTTAIPDNAKE
ncbi:protein scabrous-like isoform X2 [Sitodiplosis mosellana]|uniref:protein scabrous-like isoform X2 n=1 Tax=Sitodiplosis mosellana TaxID=263140 RepID=UPI00244461FF|nr:protein scabrous-like isoform X2 [Sitodiplosis mosellana]